MKTQISATALNDEFVKLELAATVRLELIHKLTSKFMDWNAHEHDEYNTGYMNCLIDTLHILSEKEDTKNESR